MLKNKKILIVGASRGIGEAIALGCAAEGANLVLTGRNAETGSAAAEKVRAAGGRASFIEWDVSDVEQAPAVMQRACEMMGGLNVVINNAGVIGREPFLQITEQDFDRIFSVNVKGAFFCMQAAANFFLEHGEGEVKGKIIVISSECGHQPCAHPYGVSKWSVMGMCQGYAKALFKKGIVVSNIAPGPVTTSMMKWSEGMPANFPSAFGRMAYPQEIADLAVFLASDKSNRIAGQPIYINGGLNC